MTHTFAVIGNAVVDGVAHVTDELLAAHELVKGDTNLVSAERFLTLSGAVPVESFHGGGAGANTAYTLAKLGQSVRFLARIGAEPAGEHFFAAMVGAGLTMLPPQEGVRTLEVLVLVTPDGTRTMVQPPPPGPSADDYWVEEKLLEGCDWLVVEGYAAVAHPAAVRFVWTHGTPDARKVLLLPAPAFCREHAATLATLMENDSPLVIGNHQEYEAILAATPRAAGALKKIPHVITSGHGSARFVQADTAPVEVAAIPVENPMDSTGAGDAFAAGFLLSYAGQQDAAQALRRGHQLAYAVIHQLGPRLEDPASVWAQPLAV